MQKRSPLAVFFLSLITFGIYAIVWQVKTKGELNRLGAQIPTAWLLIVPFVNWYWLWKYSEGVEHVTGGKMSGVMAFVLLFLLGFIGMAILQNEFNKLGDGQSPQLATAGQGPAQPVTPSGQPQPDNSFGGPAASESPAPSEPSSDQTPPDQPQPPQTS